MLVRCLCSGLVGGLRFVARVVLLPCVGGLAFFVCVFGGFLLLVPAWLCIPNHHVCNTSNDLILAKRNLQACRCYFCRILQQTATRWPHTRHPNYATNMLSERIAN